MGRRSARSLSSKGQLARELEWIAMGIHPEIIPIVGQRERTGSDATSYRGKLLEPLPELPLAPGAVALSAPAPDPSEVPKHDSQDSRISMGTDASIGTQQLSDNITQLQAINQDLTPQHAPSTSTQSTSPGDSSSPRSNGSFRQLNEDIRHNSQVIWTRANTLVDSGYIHILIRRYCSTPESPSTPDAAMDARISNSTESNTSTPLMTPDSEQMCDIAREDSDGIPSFSPSNSFTDELEILYSGAHCLQEYCPNRECNEWRNEKRSLEWGLVEERMRVKKVLTYNYSFFENAIDPHNLWPILDEMREENGLVEDSSGCDQSVAGDKGKGKAILSSGSSDNTSKDDFIEEEEEDISETLIQSRLDIRRRHVTGESSAQGSRGLFGLEGPPTAARMSLPEAVIQGNWDTESADSNWRPFCTGSTPPLAEFEDAHTPEEILLDCANQNGTFKLLTSREESHSEPSTQDGRRQYEGCPLPETWVGESSNRRPNPYSYDENVDVPRFTEPQPRQAMNNHSPGNDEDDDDDNDNDSNDKGKADQANPGDGADDRYPHEDQESPPQSPKSTQTFKSGSPNSQDNTGCQISPMSQTITVNLFYYLLAIPQDLQISMNGERGSDNDMAGEDDYEIMRALTQTIGNQIYWVLRVEDIQCIECVREIKKSREGSYLKQFAVRIIAKSKRPTHCLGSQYHIHCTHDSTAKLFFQRVGSENAKRIQCVRLVTDAECSDPDSLASAINVLTRKLPDLRGVRVALYPEDKTSKSKKRDKVAAKRTVKCLRALERSLPLDERLVIEDVEHHPDLMARWQEAKRPWWVGTIGRKGSLPGDVEYISLGRV